MAAATEEQFVNTTKTTLNANYTASDGVLNVVTTGSPFPQVPNFRIAVMNTTETVIKVVLKVTAINSATQWAVTAEGDDANALNGDHVVGTWWTKAAIDAFRADSCRIDTLANIPTTYQEGKLFTPSDGIYQYRGNGSSFDRIFRGLVVTEPVAGNFSWRNQGSATVDSSAGGIYLHAAAAAGDSWKIQEKNIPSAPYTVEFGLLFNMVSEQYTNAGIVMVQSSDGKFIAFTMGAVDVANDRKLAVSKYNSVTSFNAAYQKAQINTVPILFKVVDNNTNTLFYFSIDGRNYELYYTRARTDFCTPDKIGFGISTTNATYSGGVTLFHYKEY